MNPRPHARESLTATPATPLENTGIRLQNLRVRPGRSRPFCDRAAARWPPKWPPCPSRTARRRVLDGEPAETRIPARGAHPVFAESLASKRQLEASQTAETLVALLALDGARQRRMRLVERPGPCPSKQLSSLSADPRTSTPRTPPGWRACNVPEKMRASGRR